MEDLDEGTRDAYARGRLPTPDLSNFLQIDHEIGCGRARGSGRAAGRRADERRSPTVLAYRDGLSPLLADGRFLDGARRAG